MKLRPELASVTLCIKQRASGGKPLPTMESTGIGPSKSMSWDCVPTAGPIWENVDGPRGSTLCRPRELSMRATHFPHDSRTVRQMLFVRSKHKAPRLETWCTTLGTYTNCGEWNGSRSLLQGRHARPLTLTRPRGCAG